jgi:hypothetical protein
MAKKRKKFFSRQTAASRRKAAIIANYFPAWATVIRSRATKMAYIDLYAGRGVYDDGTESTPLLVLRHDPDRSARPAGPLSRAVGRPRRLAAPA